MASLVSALIPAAPVHAVPIFTDRAAWEALVSPTANVGIPLANGTILSAGSPLSLPSGTTLIFDQNLTAYEVGVGWGTWSGGLSGFPVLAAETDDPGAAVSVDATFSSPRQAFGLEVQPKDFDLWRLELTLSDGTIQSLTVDGFGGAQFVGWISDDPTQVTAMRIVSEAGALGFAVGRMAEGTVAVPDGGSTLAFCILSFGLFAAFRWKRFTGRSPAPRPWLPAICD